MRSLFLQDIYTLSTFPLFPRKWFNWVSSEETRHSLCSNGFNFPRSFRDLLFRYPFTHFLEWWLFNLNSSSASFINGSVKFRSMVNCWSILLYFRCDQDAARLSLKSTFKPLHMLDHPWRPRSSQLSRGKGAHSWKLHWLPPFPLGLQGGWCLICYPDKFGVSGRNQF